MLPRNLFHPSSYKSNPTSCHQPHVNSSSSLYNNNSMQASQLDRMGRRDITKPLINSMRTIPKKSPMKENRHEGSNIPESAMDHSMESNHSQSKLSRNSRSPIRSVTASMLNKSKNINWDNSPNIIERTNCSFSINSNNSSTLFSNTSCADFSAYELPCSKHPGKVADYVVDDEFTKLCCRKCATIYASQGVKVRRIQTKQTHSQDVSDLKTKAGDIKSKNNHDASQIRRKELQSLVTELQHLNEKLEHRGPSLERELLAAQDEKESEEERVNNFFLQFFSLLNSYKMSLLSNISSKYVHHEQSIAKQFKTVQDAMEDLQHMQSDIAESFQIVVHSVTQPEYKTIFNSYSNRLGQYKKLARMPSRLPYVVEEEAVETIELCNASRELRDLDNMLSRLTGVNKKLTESTKNSQPLQVDSQPFKAKHSESINIIELAEELEGKQLTKSTVRVKDGLFGDFDNE